MSELFDKKFVHFMWDNTLESKEGFFADTISLLKDSVDKKDVNSFGTVTKGMGDPNFPFASTGGGSYQFFYYDPNYDVKRAYNVGRQIQFRSQEYGSSKDWIDCTVPIQWEEDVEYRIKPEDYRCAKCISSDKEINCGTCNVQKEYDTRYKRMTSKMLCEWLVKKNGQYKSSTDYISAEYGYYKNDEQEELPDDYKIRRWGSDEWIEPTVKEYFDDCYPESLKEGEILEACK